MRAYIITLLGLPESVQVAERCAQSAEAHGISPQFWPGVWRDHARRELETERLKVAPHDESWSNTDAVIGNFVAQYRAWCDIVAHGEGALIMEHDAVVVAEIPAIPAGLDIVTFGKPSFGQIRTPAMRGFQPLFSSGNKVPGAHGYYLTPKGAASLITFAQIEGVLPVDKFISPQVFKITEYWPWPIEAHDSFTTIQKEKGCRSKHNFGKQYRIL